MSAEAGTLRHWVSYQEAPETPDTFGQKQRGAYTTVFSCWSLVETLFGREKETARQVRADAAARIKLRGPRAILPTGRFAWSWQGETKYLYPTEPARIDEADGSMLVVTCSETPAQ